jgi:hypothetical protein
MPNSQIKQSFKGVTIATSQNKENLQRLVLPTSKNKENFQQFAVLTFQNKNIFQGLAWRPCKGKWSWIELERASNWASVRNKSLSLNILSTKKEKRGPREEKKLYRQTNFCLCAF